MHVRNKDLDVDEEIKKFTDSVKSNANEVRAAADFVEIITPFEDILGKENVLILDGEVMIKEPDEIYGRILDFIGLTREGFGFEINKERGFPCLVKPAKRYTDSDDLFFTFTSDA